MTARATTVSAGATSLTFNVKDYGALGNGVADDSTAINAAINAARAASSLGTYVNVVFFPPGVYKCLSPIVVNGNATCTLQGAGHLASMLSFPVDLGAGVLAIDFHDSAFGSHIRDLHIQGVGTNPGLGNAPATMDGVKLNAQMRMVRCMVRGFRRGVVGGASHWKIEDCLIRGCQFGLYLPAWNGHGNTAIRDTDFSGCYLAGIGLERGSNNFFEGATFDQVHFGFAPYGFYLTGVAGEADILKACTMKDCAFESVGHAMFGSESAQGNVSFSTFIECNATNIGDVNYRVGGHQTDWSWNIDGVYNNRTVGDQGMFTTGTATGVFGPATSLTYNLIETDLNYLNVSFSGTNVLLDPAGTGTGTILVLTGLGGGGRARLLKTSVAVSQYQIVGTPNTLSTMRPWNTGDVPVGIAYTDGASGDWIPMFVDGTWDMLTSDGFYVGPFLKPDGANPGKVKAATGWSDGPVVGWGHTWLGGPVRYRGMIGGMFG